MQLSTSQNTTSIVILSPAASRILRFCSPLMTSSAPGSPRESSLLLSLFNFVACIAILPLVYTVASLTKWPCTLDGLIGAFLAELVRYQNEGRKLRAETQRARRDMEKAFESDPATIAQVVGWKEDPELFSRALASYQTAEGLRFLLVGVDGDLTEDMEMVDVFQKTYPANSRTVHLEESLGEVAVRLYQEEMTLREIRGLPKDVKSSQALAVQKCRAVAEQVLRDAGIEFSGPQKIKHLCLYQPHLHKKGILFTAFIFSLVIADILGIEYLWTSDSDTIVSPETLSGATTVIDADSGAGGSSTGLVLHNQQDTTVTRICSAVYWNELYLGRSLPASGGSSDCQSGPCAAFRVATLPPILLQWYTQRVLGCHMVVNEDRHLTTLLILSGWRVLYASDTLTATETPTTFLRWIRQQVRWARATHIESLQQPLVYLTAGPIFFFSALKREIGTLIAGFSISYYFFTGVPILPIPLIDYIGRAITLTVYNSLRNPDRTVSPWLVAPAFLFNYIPLPAVQLWSLLTLTEGGWSTSMRKVTEMRKKETAAKKWYEAGFMVVWMGIVGGALVRYLLESEVFRSAVPGLDAWQSVWMAVGFVLPALWMYHLMIQSIF